MSFKVRYTKAAREDVRRLTKFMLERDVLAAHRARSAIAKSIEFLRDFPFSCRKVVPDNPFLRELIISFGSYGYVALFEISDAEIVTIIALRHQREEDFH